MTSEHFKNIESPFVIYPREVRRFSARLDHWPVLDGRILLWGFITQDPSFRIVEVRRADGRLPMTDVPADVDPYEAGWCGYRYVLPAGDELVFLVENVGTSPARFRARFR